MHDVRAALYLLRQLAVLKRTDQMAVGVRPIINVQEVVIGLDAEAETESKRYMNSSVRKGSAHCSAGVINGSEEMLSFYTRF